MTKEAKHSLTIAAEIDALGLGGHGIMQEAEAFGDASGLELTTFREAVTRRVRQQRSGEPATDVVPFEPREGTPEEVQPRLITANMIGSTAADILLGQASAKVHAGVQQ